MGGPMIKAFVQLGLAGLIFVAATVAAEAETIVCSLTQATRTSTNAPGGAWWTTPIVNSLTNTQIVNIGGQQALQCVYGGAGAIQRLRLPERCAWQLPGASSATRSFL